MDQVQALLLQLKQNYLAELPDRFDTLEHLVLELEREGFNAETYNEFYRQVHSLKGSGGTYGIHVLTSICHPFEDFLNTISSQTDLAKLGFANIALGYLDILREVTQKVVSKPDAVFDVDHLLARLRQRSFELKYHALLVENSATVIKLISRILHQANFRIVVQDDGYQALGRALVERFDLIISAQEVRHLNGSALVAAIKLSQTGQQVPKTILLTANPTLQNHASQPDYVLSKDDQLSPRLHALLKTIVAQLDTTSTHSSN